MLWLDRDNSGIVWSLICGCLHILDTASDSFMKNQLFNMLFTNWAIFCTEYSLLTWKLLQNNQNIHLSICLCFTKEERCGPLNLVKPRPTSSQESERSCIYVLGVSILLLSSVFLLNFGDVPTVWYFLFVLFFNLLLNESSALRYLDLNQLIILTSVYKFEEIKLNLNNVTPDLPYLHLDH